MPAFFTSSDIAGKLGVTLAAVSNWRRRYGPDSAFPFPAPDEADPPRWRTERWAEIDAWQRIRGGSKTGPRGPRVPVRDAREVVVADIASRLGVTPGLVYQWNAAHLPRRFPPPREIPQGTRVRYVWSVDQWDAILNWRAWHLDYIGGRTDPDSSPSSMDAAVEPTMPSPAQFLRDRPARERSGARPGHVIRLNVRRRLR
jgi:hypothetical protein